MTPESPILRTIALYAVPLSTVVCVRIFLQGHDAPGGGFIAGVLGAAAAAIYMLGYGIRRVARVAWWRLSVFGLLVCLSNGTVPWLLGRPFMDNTMLDVAGIHLPTATFFDLGVMLIVVGTLMTVFVELSLEKR